MAKIDIGIIQRVLSESDLLPEGRVSELVTLMQRLNDERAQAEAEQAQPPVKKQDVVILFTGGDEALAARDLTAAIIKMPASEDPSSVLDKISAVAFDHNNRLQERTRPTRRGAVNTIAGALETLKSKDFKAQNLQVVTKLPVLAVQSDNRLTRGLEDLEVDDHLPEATE